MLHYPPCVIFVQKKKSFFDFEVNVDKLLIFSYLYRQRLDSQSSIVDGLLSEIYDRWHDHRHDSFDSDTFTECSSTSEFMHWRRHSVHLKIAGRSLGHLHRGILQDYGNNYEKVFSEKRLCIQLELKVYFFHHLN
jgi:hypothetical protein